MKQKIKNWFDRADKTYPFWAKILLGLFFILIAMVTFPIWMFVVFGHLGWHLLDAGNEW